MTDQVLEREEEGATAGLLLFKHPLHTPPRLLPGILGLFSSSAFFISFVVCSSSSASPHSFSPSPVPLLLSGASVAAVTPTLFFQRARTKYPSLLPVATVQRATGTSHEVLLQAGRTVPNMRSSSNASLCICTNICTDAYSYSLPRAAQTHALPSIFIECAGAAAHRSLPLIDTRRNPGGTWWRPPLRHTALDAGTRPATTAKARSCLLPETSHAPSYIFSRALLELAEPVVPAAAVVAVVTTHCSPTNQDARRRRHVAAIARNCSRRVAATWYATTATVPPIACDNRGGTSRTRLARTQLLVAGAVLPLLPTLFSGARLLSTEGLSVVQEAPSSGLAPTAGSTTRLSQKNILRGWKKRQKETNSNRRCTSTFASGNPYSFVSCGVTLSHRFTRSCCSRHTAITQTPLPAAVGVVNCKEPPRIVITLPRILSQGYSKCFSYPTFRSRAPMLFTWPSSSTTPSSSRSVCASPFASSLYLHPGLCCWRKKYSLAHSRARYPFFPPLSALSNSSSDFTAGENSILLCASQSLKRTASILGDTLTSYIRSNAVALSRIVATGTGCSLGWLLRKLPRLLNGVALFRHFTSCTKNVYLGRLNIHSLVPLPVTRKLADALLQGVATRITSLFASSRMYALMAERTNASSIAAAAVEATAECAAAAATFYSTCAASLLLQKSMGVSCAAKTCKLFGFATVVAASNAAAGAATAMRSLVEALHNRPRTGDDTAKIQFPPLVKMGLDTCPAETKPLSRDQAVHNFHASTSSLSQQQTAATPFQASAGAVANDTGLSAKTAALQHQMKGLIPGNIVGDGAMRDVQGGLTPRGIVGQTVHPDLHVARPDMGFPSIYTITESLRACEISSGVLHACVKEGLLGCVLFWLLGGRFFRLSPSSLLAPGAYHQHHLSLRAGIDYASLEERRFIKKLGETFGCHTCGRRRGVQEWVADHQPPKSVVVKFNQTWLGWLYGSLRRAFGGTRYLPQRFYPQCKTCSNKQAAVVKYNSTKTRKTDLIANWNSLRAYHLTGGVLQILRILAGW